MDDVTIKARTMDDVTINNRRMDDVTIKARTMDDVTIKARTMDDVTKNKRAVNDVTINNRTMDDVTIKARTMDDVTIKARTMDDVTINNRTMDDVTIKARTMDDVTINNRTVDAVTIDHRKCLLNAALENNMETLEQLLGCNTLDIDLNFKDNLQRTPLHCLLSRTRFYNMDDLRHALEMLRKHGADIHAQDHLLNTPLHLVFETYSTEIPLVIELTLKLYPDYEWTLRNLDGYTLFHMFMSNVPDNSMELCKVQQTLNAREDFIKRFLQGEVHGADNSVVKTLLNGKEKSGYSAFQTYLDSFDYKLDTIKLMLEKGANVNNPSNLGITPLMQASLREREDIVKLLLEAGADPNARDKFGQTVLFRVRSEQSFRLLYDYGADIYVRDRTGNSPLANYAFHVPQDLPIGGMGLDTYLSEYSTLAHLFFEKGLDPNTTDIYGSSLLHHAACFANTRVILFLLEQEAALNVKDNLGKSPYDLAVHHGNYDILNLLEIEDSKPVDPDQINSKIKTQRYFRIAINEINIDDMDNVLDMIKIKDDPEELVSLFLRVPHFGMVSRKPEASDVVRSVNGLMNKVADALFDLDPRFRASVRPTGSSSEGTMTGDPGEFDFVFCLDYFSQECEVIQTNDLLKSGFAKLSIIRTQHHNHPLKSFEKHDGFISASDVRAVFQDLMVQALNKPDIWEDDHLYFDGLLEFPDDKPILNLKISWFGAIYKRIPISVDIVPAIHKDNWFPAEVNKDTLDVFSNRVKRSGFFVLFHGPELAVGHDEYNDYVRISSASMEIEFFKTSPEIYREIYAVCKILKNKFFCPMIQFENYTYLDEELDSNSEVNEHEEIEREQTVKDTHADSWKGKSPKYWKYSYTKTLLSDVDVDDVECNRLDDGKNTDNMCDGVAIIDAETRILKSIYTPKVSDDRARNTGRVETITYAGSGDAEKPNTVDESSIMYSRMDYQAQPRFIVTNNMEPTLYKEKKNECTKILKSPKKRRTEDITSEDTYTNNYLPKVACTEEAISKGGLSEDNPYSGFFGEHPCEDKVAETFEYSVIPVDQYVHVTKRRISEGEHSVGSETHESDIDVAMSTELEGGEVVDADEYITSYMLKNCLLHVLDEQRKKSVELKPEHLNMAREIYNYLLECSQKRRLSAYCLPFIDIFSYVNEYIRGVDPDEKEVELQLLCDRISSFCKVILGLLNQGDNSCQKTHSE